MNTRARVLAVLYVAVVVGVAAWALSTLPDDLHGFLFLLQPYQYGDVFPFTLAAAVRVGLFWGVFAAVLGAILLRLDASMGFTDAILGGAILVWVIAFLVGNALGPLGLMNVWTVRGTMLAAALLLFRLGLPSQRPGRLSHGQWLVVLTLGIVGPGLLAVQLGAVVPPFMDVLATPASAQRVLTFGIYEPLDSDPYGYWDAGSQCPAAELLYAFLALGSGVPFAVLGQTAAIVPLGVLLLIAIYRFGRAIGDDRAGGFAVLLVLATMFFRVLPYSHGRTITYVLAAAGLAWFVEVKGSTVRRVLAGLALGTAVGSHAVVGALAMGVAALTVVCTTFDLGLRKTLAAVGLLAGASLVAAPEVAVGLRLAMPYPILTLAQALGVLVVVLCGRTLAGEPLHRRLVTRLLGCALGLGLLWAWAQSPPLVGGMQSHHVRFPLLWALAGLGLGSMVVVDGLGRVRTGLVVVAIAIGLGAGAERVSAEWWRTFADPRVQIAVQGFYRKVGYWYPFVWVLPAGFLLARLARWTSTGFATVALLVALFYPWGPQQDPNSHHQSIAEMWAQQAALAKGGYWGSAGHRRWAQTEAELELSRILRAEVDAGRITFATHVLHVEPFVLLNQDVVLFSVYTGINDDTYIYKDWEPDISNVGGRVFPRRELPAALAKRPPYVVVHDATGNNLHLPVEGRQMIATALPDYEEMFAADGVRLLRRPDLRPAG